ncbi:MAG: protein phosphatase 2C domain-containing protein [Symploca sp. SIO3C6]|nr:protein phosphatase 2C domain-containing protein [Symploca sp. SIO3C6]
MIWKATCHSSTGIWHQRHDLPCQDYGEYCLVDKLIIGAVADGAGSAKYSAQGAKLAVKEILDYLHKFKKKFSQQSYQLTAKIAKQTFYEGVQKVRTSLQEKAFKEQCSLNEFACTLIAFVATPDWISAMQIGDGFLVTRLYDQPSYQLFFHPDKGEFVNETTFITSRNALATMQVHTLPGKQRFICASTDGLESVSINLRNWLPFAPFFKPLETYIEQTNNPKEDKEYLSQFLSSKRLQSRTDDDKTLLICFYKLQL